ncbi:BnaA05g13590D [Brassica napus]|uniref:BnaA05g13590D protein n=3 Tax=Brassica TaxID=3705 RepID=A0A078F1A9_BRANA|nr:BnaA05g13590D [Brassica napus]
MEEKVRDRLVRLSLQSFSASSENSSAPSIRRRTRQRRPENSSVSSDLITVEFKINLGTLRFGIEGERERFDRVVFNFPHAGFHGKESGSYLIWKHRGLVFGFFQGASHMLRANGIWRSSLANALLFHVSTELHTDNMKWKQVKGGESKREQFVECTNRVCRVSSEIHIGELGRLSPRERTRFPYRYTKESPERHRLRFVKTLQFKLIKNHPQKVFMEFYKVKGRKMLIRNRYSQPSTVENYEKEA